MTVRPRTTFTKSVMLSAALYARWLAYEQATGQSFNGLILAYLDATLPQPDEEAQP